uniref:Cadherin-1 n=1 Tax=Echeneis naucrates TaxID=173247 RepID=A0A665UAP1_ECHNA
MYMFLLCGTLNGLKYLSYSKSRLKISTNVFNDWTKPSGPQVPVLIFPKSVDGLRRRKRDWVIPDLTVTENDRGPYPLKVSQIRSNEDKVKKIYYSITGPGATEPPLGLFNMDRDTGVLYVTQPLDRELVAQYKFQAHAVAEGSGNAEEPMDIVVNVIDQNDNKPVFNQDTYVGEVPEASLPGYEVITVVATDADKPNDANSDIRYRIEGQEPQLPTDHLFVINPVSGVIRVHTVGLDREKYPKYTLTVVAADMVGDGLFGKCKVILTVADSNDHAPEFTQRTLLLPSNQGLDFERTTKHTLLIEVENEVPFVIPLPTSTATVVVTVQDVNEPPIFNPSQKSVSKREDLAINTDVVQYTASDPDTARKQEVTYRIISDPAGWLSIGKNSGLITVKSLMDRESHFVKDNKYTALIGAYDNDDVPATGTGTLIIQLEDVNDNAPVIDDRVIKVCLLIRLTVWSFWSAETPIQNCGMSKTNWTARMNDTKTGIYLNLRTELPDGDYSVVLRVADNQGLEQDNTILAKVCDCKGEDFACRGRAAAATGLPLILGILGGILLLLMLVLLLLLFARRRRGDKKEPLLQDDDIRDNIYYYDEEGGGEDDQDFDLSVLHRGLDNRPGVTRDDVLPNFMPAPQYRPRPANPEEIGNFIDDNLKAADNDPTAPPYDSLLVFDYEGGGSDAGSLSSLNSSSSGDQDYDCLNEWGPRFKKLADMYGGGDDDML